MSLRIFVVFSIIVISAVPALAERKTTLYLDGAVIENSFPATNGIVQVLLPGECRVETLRVRANKDSVIKKVETFKAQPDNKINKEIEAIEKRKEQLQSRLDLIDTKEDIFIAAAKSQSSKSLKKTKNDPTPLSSVRQGTDFALSRLDALYFTRQSNEKELKALDNKFSALKKSKTGKTFVKVSLDNPKGSVNISCIDNTKSWTPVYVLKKKDDNTVQFSITSGNIIHGQNEEVAAVLSKTADSEILPVWRYSDSSVPFQQFNFALEGESVTSRVPFISILTMTNSSGFNLPAGKLVCYEDREYMGIVDFKGAVKDEIMKLQCGSR
ncbi:MAG: DUF4140 domain-containing protein [Desulfuromonadales bacterium]|nr:DUF4140 domain-containing protein [Desulfuromonadales bacterium]